MRLLCTTNLEIIDVPDDAVPPYAILSHTWGRGEVTYQDVWALQQHKEGSHHREHIKGKLGFAKVRDSAALAKERGLSRIWIDTCCIDKTSSAELSEAINSMYRWYQEAQECYAYLTDVERKDEEELDGGNHSDGNPDNNQHRKVAKGFANSRWFMRGWTLQELIAPQTVYFYDKHWLLLGSKSGTRGMPSFLSRLTGVDRGVLAGHMQPSDLSVASRMRWVADRRTTRTEDLAYCLMGIFDVNMPLLYGEGAKSFTRLQEEILKVTDDQSIFAWAIPDSGNGGKEEICGLLAKHPKQFKDIRSMNPLPPLLGRESVPSSFTNQGLRVQLQLRPVASVDGMNVDEAVPEEYIAILDCSVTTGSSHFWPALHLQRLWNDQFARIQPQICRYLPAPAVAGSEYQVVYVKQKPKHVIPELLVSMSTTGHGTMFMDLEEVHPTTRWNPHSMTLKSVYSSGNGVMGAFRFSQKGGEDGMVDVIVGIRPSEFQLKTRQATWEAWCFQRRCDNRSLREVFETWDKTLQQSETSRPGLVEYQYMYGEDHRLLSSAQVVETMMYGRLFFSVLVLKRSELAINAELVPSITPPFPKRNGDPIEGPSLESLIAELTGPCFTATFFGEERARLEKGIRTKERYNSNWLPLVSGLKAHPTMGADAPSARRKPGDWMRFTRSLASGSMNMELWNSKLLEACRRGDSDKVKELLRRGASVNCCTRNMQFNPWGFTMEGLTPLHWAIVTKSESIISELMHEGANIMAASTDKWNTLHFLALRYDTDEALPKAIVEKLEGLPEDDLVTLARAKVSDMLETPLHLVCGRGEGNKQLFDILSDDKLGLRKDRNAQGELPLHRAAASGNLYAVSYYVDYLESEGILEAQDEELRTPVWHAAGAGSNRPQSRQQQPPPEEGRPPPTTNRPSSGGTIDTLVDLLSAGANANLADNLGRTPLHVACREGRADAVDVLLEHSAYATSPSAYIDMTPYHFAALFQNELCLQTLVERRPPAYREFDQPTNDGCLFTPLHLAAANGWHAGVMMLVSRGANVEKGCTHYIRKGHAGNEQQQQEQQAQLPLATAADGGRKQDAFYVPELVEMPSTSVFELVDNILASKNVEGWEEPRLRSVKQFLERIPREPQTQPQSAQSQQKHQQSRGASDQTVQGSPAIPRTGNAEAQGTESEAGKRSRKQTIEGQGGLLTQKEFVVDLSSYDGGIALDLPTPGFSADNKMELGDILA
ncbi:hypothetical protein MKZ38_007186 [Zalerion maritima]|uniref:Heterokaryon incompatibility domain-containing protein n=1 Tax=Zalerion maritima TaxID=339359 RepID=A0AAD5RI91_9PEZI|nr:hypothetical protein MKZ38_007186 [Zalerion maritima]